MSANFKTCMFGGFDREDVVSYIEKTAKETQEKLDALESENTRLKADNERIEQALRTLHAQAKQMKQDEQDQETLQQRLDEAQARAAGGPGTGFVHPVEPLKNPLPVLLRNTDAVVADLHPHL